MVSPRVAKRRALLFDAVCAACLAAIAIVLAAGIGVVGFFALIVVLALGLWLAIEAGVRRVWGRRHKAG